MSCFCGIETSLPWQPSILNFIFFLFFGPKAGDEIKWFYGRLILEVLISSFNKK